MHPTSDRPSIWLALSLLTGLPIALWVYKCFMLVVFQRKIIYMGYVPPGARNEELEHDVPPEHLTGIRCEEIRINSEKKIRLSGIIVRERTASPNEPPSTVIVYFQGNAGNPLHRLPVFQKLLQPTPSHPTPPHEKNMAIIAVAPRSYWKSTPRSPTERGILTDYTHILKYTLDRFPSSPILVYGHSLGGAAAVCLLAQLRTHAALPHRPCPDPRYANIKGLVLENPFASIPGMVRALYPERWVPYRHLAPLAFDKWDAVGAMADVTTGSVLQQVRSDTMVFLSENDEIVPPQMGAELFGVARAGFGEGEGRGRMVVVRGALHENAWERREWVVEMRRYLAEMDRS